MKEGNVSFFFASLRVSDKTLFKSGNLKDFTKHITDKLGFTIRKVLVENYQKPKNANTVVAFLNESHLILTSYPEKKLLELEYASCKEVGLGEFIGWLAKYPGIEMLSELGVDKDESGHWSRGL